MSCNCNKDESKMPAATPLELAAIVEYSPGSIVSKTIAESKVGTMTLFAFDKGEKLSEHKAPFNAYVQVLDGTAELVIGGEPVQAGAGEVVLMPANIPHAVNARERFKMLLTMFMA